jgi:transposase
MLTHDAFGKLLNLPKPWLVDRMEIDPQSQEAHVWLTHGSTSFSCPKCHSLCPVHDHTAERTWRHLDLWKAKTFIHARLPRVRCSTHGVLQIEVPWATPFLGVTMDMEIQVIQEVLACKTVAGACGILRMGWDQVRGVMAMAVDRGVA